MLQKKVAVCAKSVLFNRRVVGHIHFIFSVWKSVSPFSLDVVV